MIPLPLRRRALPFALVFLALANAATAGDLYKCTFAEKRSNLGYLSSIVVFERAEGSDTVSIMDAVIQQEVGEPLRVKLSTDNDRKLSMVWEVKIVSPENDYMRVVYRLSLQKADQSATFSASPLNYSNKFWTDGTCQVAKQ